ncbi:MAG: hypothetical protein IH586_05395 [Anaerolineaceae bacterium]|nr:hypothetical protein [Anaerolineaceae bacterium]
MQTISSDDSLRRYKQIILLVMLAQAILALAAGSMYLFGGKPLLATVELLAAFALGLFLLTIAFLWFSFLRRPAVNEKFRLKKQIQRSEGEMITAQETLGGIQQRKETLESQFQQRQAAEQEVFDKLEISIQQELIRLGNAKDQELSSALTALKKAHITDGLKNAILDPVLVPGIGELLADKLTSNGILTAFDVSQENIQRIPGFGEAKSLSLLRWRESEESKLIPTQPSSLPVEDQVVIDQKYDQLMLDKKNEARSAQSAHEVSMQALLNQQTNDLQELADSQASTGSTLSNMQTQIQELRDQHQQYSAVTFPRILVSALASGSDRWFNRALAWVSLAVFAVLGLLNTILLIAALIRSRS